MSGIKINKYPFEVEEDNVKNNREENISVNVEPQEKVPIYKLTVKQIPKPFEILLAMMCIISPLIFGSIVWTNQSLNEWCLRNYWLWVLSFMLNTILTFGVLLRKTDPNLLLVIVYLICITYCLGVGPSLNSKL